MAVQNAFVKRNRHYRGGISVRLSKGEFDWFGFRMQSGFIFSNSGEYCYVFTGKTGIARDNRGYYKTIRVFVRNAPDPRASFRDFNGEDWHVEWLSSRDPLAAKILRKQAEWAKQGWIIRSNKSLGTSTGRHFAEKSERGISRRVAPWERDEAPKGYTYPEADKASPMR